MLWLEISLHLPTCGICPTSQKGVLSPGVKVRQGQEAKPGMGSQPRKRGEAYSGRKCAVVLVCLWVTAQWGCECCQVTGRTLMGEMLVWSFMDPLSSPFLWCVSTLHRPFQALNFIELITLCVGVYVHACTHMYVH